MAKPPPPLSARARAFALVCLQLALVLLVVYRFDLESEKYFFPVLCLAAGGFAVHAWLPRRLRPAFFVLLSLAGTLFVLGWPNGAWVIGIGAGLIALCRLPLPLAVRVLLLVAAGAQLAALRVQFPLPFWPVLASMFMFRLIVYLFETRHERGRPPLVHTLAYFFPLPNVCFPLFPVLDFKTFRQTYYDEDDYAVYQTGVAWLVRGLTHLLLYRLVKYYLLPAPHQLRDWPHLLLFLAANYALYLRVSGWFHIVTGLLHLFGFNLPRTHHNYFLASSFSDVWRRINVYWKDFMTTVFFFPAFFALRRGGTRLALAGAALFVFVATWLLHSYQLFWLVGDLSLTRNDAVLWLGVGTLVAVNLLLDLRRAAAPLPSGAKAETVPAPAAGQALWGAVALALRTVGMFLLVSFFWACWTMPGFVSYLHLPTGLERNAAAGAAWALGALLGVVAAGAVVKLAWDRVRRAGLLPLRPSFGRSVAVRLATLVLLVLAGTPEVTATFGPSAARVAATLRRELRSPAEAGQLARGYYEEIADTHIQGSPWAGSLSGHDKFRGDPTTYLDMTRPTGPLLGRELIPGWRGVLAGRPLSVNSLGMRDREGITRHKPAGSCRIALVGSSVVMGYGVADGEVFNRLLEARLNAAPGGPRYELLNFGTGKSWAIQRRVLVERKVFAFEPDALYYFAHQDEFIGTVSHLAGLVTARVALPYPCLTEVVGKAGARPDRPREEAEGRLIPHAREVVLGLYRGLADDCRRRGVLPVWVYLPMPGVTEVSLEPSAFIGVAEEAGFVVLDLSGWADGRAPAEVKLPGGDHHANALGHRLIADRLFAELRARPELLPAFARLRP
jgi:hypothetical protein